jgi:hypothetical protein
VTTLALALSCWLDRAIVVEADMDGGVLAARHGLRREPGLLSLAASRGQLDPFALADHSQHLDGGLSVVPAPESAVRATHLWHAAGGAVTRQLVGADGVQVVIDLGRLRPQIPTTELARQASILIVVARPRADELLAAGDQIEEMRGHLPAIGLVTVGPGPYRPADAAAELDVDLLGALRSDERAAGAINGSGQMSRRSLAKSPLLRGARSLAAVLAPTHATLAAELRDDEVAEVHA